MSPGILAVFLLGLFWKKLMPKGQLWGCTLNSFCFIPKINATRNAIP
ncbi:hypothetical protein ACU42Y_17135 [Proteus mirabilis]